MNRQPVPVIPGPYDLDAPCEVCGTPMLWFVMELVGRGLVVVESFPCGHAYMKVLP